MKSTTFHQKVIFSAKIFVCTLILGVLGWLSFASPMQPASASSATLSVTIQISPPWVSVEDIGRTGQGVPIVGESGNVDAVRVYLDVDGSGDLSSGDVLLDGTINVAEDGTVTGIVQLPDGLDGNTTYKLIVEGDTINNNAGAYDDHVYQIIEVYYVTEASPNIDCIYNYDNDGSSCPWGQPNQAFGPEDGETTIVINGENFGDGTGVKVIVGGQECAIKSVSDTQIICVVPPALDGQSGPQDVAVCVNGVCDIMIGGFKYEPLTVPGVPGTGLFRIGDTVVTVKDIMFWGGLVIIVAAAAMLIMIVKTPRKASYSVKNGASKKRNYRKQKVAFSSTKKPPKRK